ncbi:MAG TPA: BMP family ABC transporter substrate-binding protein [Fimbriimonadaceae bacterium]|nr:BMP family ABC transporter substrate-binding protein [Fimbriimonadaceae bacterium]
MIGSRMKAWSLVAAVVAAVCVAGCGNKGGDAATGGTGEAGTTGSKGTAEGGKALKIGVVFDSGGLGDKSFNDSAWAGVQRAMKDFGVEEKHVESKSMKDVETNLVTLTEQGCDIVFAIGINMKDAIEKVAAENPNQKYAIVDATPDPSKNLTNVRSLLFKEEEGSFLAGYLAGLTTKTNKIGFVGGMEIDLIKKFYSGYAAGAKMANPNVEILPAKYTGDWNNVDLAKAAANTLFSQGADIVYHAAGRAGLGVIDAAKEQDKLAIGVDSDQDAVAPGFVLTSMIKRVDEAVYQTVKDLKDGSWSAGEKIYDLKAGGVTLSPMEHTKDKVPADAMQKLEDVKTKISSGEIKVPSTLEELAAFTPAG